MIILDTNVISALMRPERNVSVVEWADSRPQSVLWTTAVSLMEVRGGLLFMPDGKRRSMLERGFDQLLHGLFASRLLPFDLEAAEQAAQVDLIQSKSGRAIGVGDIQIAGIARARNATLATRNVKNFETLGIEMINPWDEPPVV